MSKIIKNERGASQIIEMALVFPVVLFTLGFLIYAGMYILQGVTMLNNTQRAAIISARTGTIPGYYTLYDGTGLTNKVDFNEGIVPNVSKVMSDNDPYRYLGGNFLKNSSSIEAGFKTLNENTSFVSGEVAGHSIKSAGGLLNRKVIAEGTKAIPLPGLLKVFGIKDRLDITTRATANAMDPAEFIRNTNMVFDIGDTLAEQGFGKSGKSLKERVGIYKQRFVDLAAKVGIDVNIK